VQGRQSTLTFGAPLERGPGPTRPPAFARLLLVAACLAGFSIVGCREGSHETPLEAVDLGAAERQVFSQFGEDGVIERIFEVIEPTRKFVVEFGAHDGKRNSNARNLIANHGWSALLIEGHPGRAQMLAHSYRRSTRVKTLEAWIFPGNVEILFEENGVPQDLDLLVIDIDSNDYYVWRAIHDFRPKVVMIESNLIFAPPQRMVIEFHPMNYWDGTYYAGASLQSYYELAQKKGYELLHCMTAGPNVIFVDAQYFHRFGILDNSPSAMFKAWYAATDTPPAFPEDKRKLSIDAFEIEKKLRLDR
jgi:hypothetical protein